MKNQNKKRRKRHPAKLELTVCELLSPNSFGIHPRENPEVSPEMDLNNTNLLNFAAMRREELPKNHPVITMAFKLAKLAAEKHVIVSVLNGGHSMTFARDNYGSLVYWATRAYDSGEPVVVLIRRFEEGPKEPRTGFPYKTIGGMRFDSAKWDIIEEDNMKRYHNTDHATGKALETEKAVLFSTIPEMFPELSRKRQTREAEAATNTRNGYANFIE